MNIIRIYVTDSRHLGLEVSPWVWAGAAVLVLAWIIVRRYDRPIHVVEVNISLAVSAMSN